MKRTGWDRRLGFWVEEALPHVPNHPTEAKETLYGRIIIPFVRAVLRAQAVELTIQGSEHVPTEGPALIAANHTGYLDFVFAGTSAYLRGRRLIRFMAKREIFAVPVVGALMRGMKHISVDRAEGAPAMSEAVRRLVEEQQLVGIFPEGTISRSFEVAELRTGGARIAQEANVPYIPLAIWGSQRIITKEQPKRLGRNHIPVWMKVGAPVDTSGTPEEVTKRMRQALQELLAEVREDYMRAYGPFEKGLPWMPAELGGTAPTREESNRRAQEERRLRALHRQEKQEKHEKLKAVGKKSQQALPAKLWRLVRGALNRGGSGSKGNGSR